MKAQFAGVLAVVSLVGFGSAVLAATAGRPSPNDLVVAEDGRTRAVVVASPEPGPEEKLAAEDLVKYIGLMCGAEPRLANTPDAIEEALASDAPLLIVGKEALKAKPELRAALERVVKKNPILSADAIVLKREGNRVYLAGVNDRSHYFAVAELLRRWGCRWFMQTEFGECIPEEPTLTVGELDYAYGPPFEVRTYWISWLGDYTGYREFQRRNMMTDRGLMPPTGHALGKYTKDAPGAKGTFNFPITKPSTAEHVAAKVQDMFCAGQNFSLGMEDGIYNSDYPPDQELMKLQWDKYFLRWSMTDAMLEFYNNVARILLQKCPERGFLPT